MHGLQRFKTKENTPNSLVETKHSSSNQTYPVLVETKHSSSNQTYPVHLTGSSICSNNPKNSYAATNIEQDQHINQPHQQTNDIQELKNMIKSLFEQMGRMLNLLTTVLTKLN
jgi:hypothetical protein